MYVIALAWWAIPAIIGGAAFGLVAAGLIGLALKSRGGESYGPGGGPRWRTSTSAERYAEDNRLAFNPAAIAVGIGLIGGVSALAIGLALGT